MRKTIVLGTTALLLGGCAIPVPLQVASWAVDGISLLMTEKSVTDHGISIVAQKDCAIWRGVVDGELCRDDAETDVMIADAETPKDHTAIALATKPTLQPQVKPVAMPEPHLVVESYSPPVKNAYVAPPRSKAEAATSSTMHALRAVRAEQAVVQPVSMSSLPKVTVKASAPAAAERVEVAKWSPPPKPEFLENKKPQLHGDEPAAGIYFVIGSFRNRHNADQFSVRYDKLAPAIISAKLDGKKIYRVVVGPVKNGHERVTHKTLRRAGLHDTWGIRVNPADWLLAKRSTDIRNKKLAEVADLSK